MKIIRSRSAERLRGYIRNELHDNNKEDVRPESSVTRQLQSSHLEQNFPVLGHARAIVTCHPNVYDQNSLSYRTGDIIEILHMNPNGLWRGRCGNKVGLFRFVNVELLPDITTRGRSRTSRKNVRSEQEPIGNIVELLRTLDMKEHVPVFVLNGYEDLTLFKDLDEDELDYLGIHDTKHREKLIEMARLLFPSDNKNYVDNESLHVKDDETVNDYNYQRK